MADCEIESYEPTYDVVASYIRVGIRENNQIEWNITCNEELLYQLLPKDRTSYECNEVLTSLKEIAHRFVPIAAENACKVTTAWKSEVDFLLDPSAEDWQLESVFSQLMLAWFKQDGKAMSWIRLVFILEFVVERVYKLMAKIETDACARHRVTQLLDICVKFIRERLGSWLECHGGWRGVIEQKPAILCQSCHDIPDTAVYTDDPSVTPFFVGGSVIRRRLSVCEADRELSVLRLKDLEEECPIPDQREMGRHQFLSAATYHPVYDLPDQHAGDRTENLDNLRLDDRNCYSECIGVPELPYMNDPANEIPVPPGGWDTAALDHHQGMISEREKARQFFLEHQRIANAGEDCDNVFD